MKKIMMTLAAVLCCAMTTTTVFTSCGDDEVTYEKGYAYEVVWDYLASADYVKSEAQTIEQQMNAAVGHTGSMITYAKSPSDDQMKRACDNIVKNYSQVKSVYLVFRLYRWKADATPGAQNTKTEIATYAVGLATTRTFVLYSCATSYDASHQALREMKSSLDSAVYRASYKTMLTLKNDFPNVYASFTTSAYPDAVENDQYIANVCDSIMAAHASDTLAVDMKFAAYKTNVVSQESKELWSHTLKANIP